MNNNLFKDFTNLFSLTKTLRFELRPTLETKSLAEVIKEDKDIDRLYNEEMKPMFDKLHEEFITDSLENVKLSVDKLVALEKSLLEKKEFRKDKKLIKEIIYELENKKEEEIVVLQKYLREEVVKLFNKKGDEWRDEKYPNLKLKDVGYKILTEARVLEILKLKNPDKKEIIEKFGNFFTYFSGFIQNRENYYSNEDKSTSVANRVINENLARFLDNKQKFEEVFKKVPQIKKFEEVFSLENYDKCLTQLGIEKFNLEIVGEINKELNLFSQQNKGVLPKAPKLKFLYKQIGCGKRIFGLFSIIVGNEWKELENLQNNKDDGKSFSQKELLEKIRKLYKFFFDKPSDYELDKIYFNKQSINTISSMWFINWHKLSELLSGKRIIKNKNKETGEYTIPKKISLADLKNILESETNVEDLFKKGKINEDEIKENKSVGVYEKLFSSNGWETFLAIWKYEINKSFQDLDNKFSEFEIKKQTKFQNLDKKERVFFIKEFCDAFLAIERMVKYHKVDENNDTDDNFYETIDLYLQETELRKYYDAFRNYLTKKPFDENKIKLNFENGSLLGGWSDGQERNKGAVILKNGDKFYLGILKDRGFFRTDKENKLYVEDSNWKRLILTNLKFQTLAGKGFLGKYGKSYGEIGKVDPLKAVSLLQEFIQKNYLTKYPKLRVISEKEYNNKKEFDKEIKEALEQSFDMHFNSINFDVLKDGVKNEKLYLFEIVNKDLVGKERKGNNNIHTLYWLEMFLDGNLQSPKLALNGGGEIFFRQGQRDKLITKIVNEKEVLDAKRYADDKFFLHVPITINYGKPKNIKFKELINNFVKENIDNVSILGIDRGEKHLLYYSLVNNNGEIIKQGSFNKIKCGNKIVDYNELLSKRAKEMMEARQSWETIGKIKDLKEGYLSQVIHEIYKLVIENNAIVVLEDLNTEFKAKRTAKVEKSVYKKFELALVKKLNHLILKEKEANELGGSLNAYQLAPYIKPGDVGKFEKAKQWGIMFYVRPDYTSQTDPVTGWRKTIYISNAETIINIKKKWKDANIKIYFDSDKKCFKFSYDKWELCAYPNLERLYWNRSEKNVDGKFGNMKKYSLHKEFECIFEGMDKSKNISDQMFDKEDFNWKSFIFYWNLLNQIRNSDKSKNENESDFIQSPIWSEKINDFFDSRKKYQIDLPENGDANGAYNIARKGIMIVDRINENPQKPDLFIKNTDWDNFSQK